MSDYSWKEMMAVMFSREIKDTDKITSGAHTEIFFAATMLAQKTHAPNLKLQLGGSVTLCQVTDIDVPELPKTSTGYDLIRYAESVHDHPDTYLFYGAPGGKDYYKEGSEYRNVNHFWFADKFFVGGIQADKWGNTNMIGLVGKDGKMSFRGPGTIGINDIAVGVRDTYVFLTAHDKRRLVEKVDYISHPGRKVCRENEFYGGGPKWIVTPKCIFDFDPDTLEARLVQVFPGVTVDDVKANTGFEVKSAKKVETVPPPSKDELEALRNEVDKTGVLRH
jgi:glutaconate CoA-transferase, subunit B